MSSDHIRQAAGLLLDARRSGHALSALPAELLPATVGEAYAVQDLVTERIGPIGGWKTAPAKQGRPFNWAPIPAAGIFPDGVEIDLDAWPRAMLELEIGLLLGSDLPQRVAPYRTEDIVDAVAEVRVCLELFASRYADFTTRSAMEKLADAQNAAGVVIGTGTADWQRLDLAQTELVLEYAGNRSASTGGSSLAELFEACVHLANGAFRLGGLKAGHIIITGARIGPIAATRSGLAQGGIAPVGTVSATFL